MSGTTSPKNERKSSNDSNNSGSGPNCKQDVLNTLLKEAGQLRKGIRADNSSVFACFSDLIYFGGENFPRVKQTFLDHIAANQLQYSEVVSRDSDKDIATYMADIQQSRATTSMFELKILSELYSVNVELFTFDGDDLVRVTISNRYINSLTLVEYQPGKYDLLISSHAIIPNVNNNNTDSSAAIYQEQEDFVITRSDSGLAARRKDFGDLTVTVAQKRSTNNAVPSAGGSASSSTAGTTVGTTPGTAGSSSKVSKGGFNFRKDSSEAVTMDFSRASRVGGAMSAPTVRSTQTFDFRRAESLLKDKNTARRISATSRKIPESGGTPGRNFFNSRNDGKRVPDMFQFRMEEVREEKDEDGGRNGSNAGTPIPPGFNPRTLESGDDELDSETPGKKKAAGEKSNMIKTKNFVPETRSIQRYYGTLKFFDEKNNYGFIVMDGGGPQDIFIHYDDLCKSEVPKNLLKMKNKVLRFSFVLMEYKGKSRQSKKAIDISLEEVLERKEPSGGETTTVA